MADRPLSTPLPADLPEDWTSGQIVAPSGADAGLSQQHGYNYLMAQVNAAQRAANAINESFDDISGKRTCRVTIGTSAAGWTQADCDYLCDGTDDQEELSAAIEAVFAKGGGEIAVLAGEYALTQDIAISGKAGSLSITGEGGVAVLVMSAGIRVQAAEDGTFLSLSGLTLQCAAESTGFVSANYCASLTVRDCVIRDVHINAEGYGGAYGFVFQGNRVEAKRNRVSNSGFVHVLGSGRVDVLISGNHFYVDSGPDSYGLDFKAIFVQVTENESSVDSGRHIVLGNTITATGADKAAVDIFNNAVVSNNILFNTNVDIGPSCTAVGNVVNGGYIAAGLSSGTLIFGNTIKDGNICAFGLVAVAGNFVKAGPAQPAICVGKVSSESELSEAPSITGNYIAGGSVGVRFVENNFGVQEVSCALVSGNRIFGCDTPIQIESNWSHCLVTGNLFPAGSGVVDKGTDNIVRLNSDDTGGGSGGGTAGVTTFNGRSGAVLPKNGDYTAGMVGAVESGAAQSIQVLTQAQYDALAAKDPSTLYLIKE